MLNTLYRIVAMISIIAHLNLIIFPSQVAYAGYPRIEGVEEGGISTTISKPVLKKPFLFQDDDHSFVKSVVLSSAVIILASILEDADPLYYCLAYVIGFMLPDKIIPTFLALIPFVGAANINGPQKLHIQRDNSSLVHYTTETAPFLEGVEPTSPVYTTLDNIFSANEKYNRTYVNFLAENTTNYIVEAIKNSSYNITLTWTEGYMVDFVSTAKNLKAFLTNLSFPVPTDIEFQQIFHIYNNTDVRGKYFFFAERIFDVFQAPDERSGLIRYCARNALNCAFAWTGILLAPMVAIGCGFLVYWRIHGYLYPAPTDESIQLKLMETINSKNENVLNYKAISEDLEQIESLEICQNVAWGLIQHYQKSQSEDLFNLCDYVGKNHPAYKKTIKIQADYLDTILKIDGINSNFKDVFHEQISKLENKERRQGITWQYIQKYIENIRAKGVQVLFDMCGLIEESNVLHEELIEDVEENNSISEDVLSASGEELKEIVVHHLDTGTTDALKEILDQESATTLASTTTSSPWWNQNSEKRESQKPMKLTRYEQAISIQAQCLREILEQESGTATSHELTLILINKEFERVEVLKRRQDLSLELIDKSNIQLDAKLNLCDQIPANHPRYNMALVLKADLIDNDPRSASDEISMGEGFTCERFKKVMGVLFQLPDDAKIKISTKNSIEKYLVQTGIQGKDFEQLKKFDLKDGDGLTFFLDFVQKSLALQSHSHSS